MNASIAVYGTKYEKADVELNKDEQVEFYLRSKDGVTLQFWVNVNQAEDLRDKLTAVIELSRHNENFDTAEPRTAETSSTP